jgi:hypothetical protein
MLADKESNSVSINCWARAPTPIMPTVILSLAGTVRDGSAVSPSESVKAAPIAALPSALRCMNSLRLI